MPGKRIPEEVVEGIAWQLQYPGKTKETMAREEKADKFRRMTQAREPKRRYMTIPNLLDDKQAIEDYEKINQHREREKMDAKSILETIDECAKRLSAKLYAVCSVRQILKRCYLRRRLV